MNSHDATYEPKPILRMSMTLRQAALPFAIHKSKQTLRLGISAFGAATNPALRLLFVLLQATPTDGILVPQIELSLCMPFLCSCLVSEEGVVRKKKISQFGA